MRIKKLILLLILTIILFLLCIVFLHLKAGNKESHIITDVPNLHNGDAKFYDDYILTTLSGNLVIYDQKGNEVKSFSDIRANWIYCQPEDHLIVYANTNKQVGILLLDDNLDILFNKIVMETPNLQIDPTIVKVDETYYMTVTEIDGTVNNADPNAENGTYTLHLYKSDNLTDWELAQDIIPAQNNIEDVDLFYDNDRFYVTFEKETVDKGDSSIHVAILDRSLNSSLTTIYQLLDANCDHEPATIVKCRSGYRLYYSCDKNYHGESYAGAQIFYADYDKNWNPIRIDQEVHTQTTKGILLYDVKKTKKGELYLYSQNYSTDCNMIIEEQ